MIEKSRSFLFGDRDASVRRVQLFAIASLLLCTVGIGVVTRSAWQVVGTLAAGSLMLLNFRGLVSVTDSILDQGESQPSVLQMAFLMGRYALLGIVLCAIVLAPGVGPIPVALGLSILVIAILLEAILQLFPGVFSRH
ncbi:MAG: hypothetical protein GKS06_04770 [Acidobacteria bacterium]|nr:hypothetical protein [Acidobacteriota bacterium]